MTRQRVRDFHEPPDVDIDHGLATLIVGVLLVAVRYATRQFRRTRRNGFASSSAGYARR